jgi:hypothetical protein
MFDLGQKVVVITGNAITFNGVILARAKGDNGPGAYKVVPKDSGPGEPGQWHKASDVFAPEKTAQEERDAWDGFLKG